MLLAMLPAICIFLLAACGKGNGAGGNAPAGNTAEGNAAAGSSADGNAPAGNSSAGSTAAGSGAAADSISTTDNSEFEKALGELAAENGCSLSSVLSVTPEGKTNSSVVATVLIQNDEQRVNDFLSKLAELVKNSGQTESLVISFGDIEKANEPAGLLSAIVSGDGSWEISQESIDYNSERNLWIRGQFEEGSGAHPELERLIRSTLPDASSYKHRRTIYHDLKTEDFCAEINRILEKSGSPERVEVGDIYIQTNFTAKDASGKTVNRTAYGIGDYSERSVRLVRIE